MSISTLMMNKNLLFVGTVETLLTEAKGAGGISDNQNFG